MLRNQNQGRDKAAKRNLSVNVEEKNTTAMLHHLLIIQIESIALPISVALPFQVRSVYPKPHKCATQVLKSA
jgi:hypothetical protein